MLLSEGMNLKVLLLPDGDDPDSFARKHTASDFRQYIEEKQTDFIQFKTDLLLKNERDPLKRSEAINSIVESIAMVQNQILRDTYLHDCAQRIGISESTLINQMNKFIRNGREQKTPQVQTPIPKVVPVNVVSSNTPTTGDSKVQQMLIQLVIRHGKRVIYNNVEDEEGNLHDINIIQYVSLNLSADNLRFNNELYNRILEEAVEHVNDDGFDTQNFFINHEDITISKLAADMSQDKFHLCESQQVKNDQESLRNRTLHLILDFRKEYLDGRLKAIKRDIAQATNDMERMRALMSEYQETMHLRNELAKKLGNNIMTR